MVVRFTKKKRKTVLICVLICCFLYHFQPNWPLEHCFDLLLHSFGLNFLPCAAVIFFFLASRSVPVLHKNCAFYLFSSFAML